MVERAPRRVVLTLGVMRSKIARSMLACCLAAGSATAASCEIDSSKLDLSVDADAVARVLAELFPELSDEELAELAKNLDVEAVLALKTEIGDIRELAARLGRALFTTAEERVEQRTKDLAQHNQGFPASLEAVGVAAFHDAGRGEARIDLSGVFSNQTAVQLSQAELTVSVEGQVLPHELKCLADGTSVDVVFLVDITGSMSPVIKSVRRSLAAFVDAIAESGLVGTVSVVTFQDSVGVNVSFQESAPGSGAERSPFFTPVPIADRSKVDELQRFIARLEANSGADLPENLSGAVDFARSNVIGLNADGAPNVIGEGNDDPPDVSPWPALRSERQVFVALTDATFHADSRNAENSSLQAPFKPRPASTILGTLQRTGTTVHVSDPSWVDESTLPTGSSSEVEVDSDYFAAGTGGLGEDRVVGYSLVDLELVVVAAETGLLDITLDRILTTSCTARVTLPSLEANASLRLELAYGGEQSVTELKPIRL